MRRLLGVVGVLAVLLAAAQPVAAIQPLTGRSNTPTRLTPSGKVVSVPKSASGKLAQSDPDLIARTDSALVNIMVKIDADPIASYQGGVMDLQATSPAITGKTLSANGSSVSAYNGYLLAKSATIHRSAVNKVPGLRIGRDFPIAFGGFSAQVPANQAKNLLDVPGVAAVMYDSVEHPTALDSANFIGASQVWPSLGGDVHAGQGTIIGVLDTGIWPEHPMLADKGIPNPGGGPYDCNLGNNTAALGPKFTCNDKMLGAYAFVDTNLLVNGGAPAGYFCNTAGTKCSARDAEGHGTHTSTTAAGDVVNSAVLLGVDRGPVSGIAPGASVIMYRVCIADSCYQSDSVQAVEQAITDNVDVINFSIGGGGNPYSDPVELAFLDAYASGIAVNASAGNSGPGAGTAEHGGPWVTTVGASTLDRSFESTLHMTADGGASLDIQGVTVTAGITSPTPVILASASPYSDALCETPPTNNHLFTGKIVVCERGNNARVDKGHNAYLGGAAGFILYNQSAGVTDLESDNHWLPAIQVQYTNNAVKKFVKNHTHVMATWQGGTATAAQGDVMASFSSRGPDGDFIKPDVTAPGIQILAGNDAATGQHRQRPFRPAVPGDRRYVHVQSARGRRFAAAQGGPPIVDAGPDQVRAHDLVHPGRGQGERLNTRRSVRSRRRLHSRQPRGQSDGHVRRQPTRLLRVVERPAVAHRPQPAQHRRSEHARRDQDAAHNQERQRLRTNACREHDGAEQRVDRGHAKHDPPAQ